MIDIFTEIRAKIIVIVVENREPYYFIIICKCKKVLLSLFAYQMLASTFDYDERSIYYKVYDCNTYNYFKCEKKNLNRYLKKTERSFSIVG